MALLTMAPTMPTMTIMRVSISRVVCKDRDKIPQYKMISIISSFNFFPFFLSFKALRGPSQDLSSKQLVLERTHHSTRLLVL